MSNILNATVVAGCASPYGMLAIWDEERSDLFSPRFNWTYHLRAKENAGQPSLWQELWTSPRIAGGDPTLTSTLLGQDATEAGRFEYPSTISRGIYRPWFFRGICRDNNSNPLGGVVVEIFLTANDQWVGNAQTNDQGYYEAPTPYSGVNHYLVAHYDSGNLAGVTVNTLQPSL